MISSLVIGQRRVGSTLLLTFWPCGPRSVAAALRELPFKYAGILLRAEGDAEGVHYPRVQDLGLVGEVDGSRVSVSRKQLLTLLEERDLRHITELRFLMHRDAAALKAQTELNTLHNAIVVHLHQRESVDFMLPMRKSLILRLLGVLIDRGDADPTDTVAKTDAILRRVMRLKGHEALAVHWFEDRMLTRIVRRDDLDTYGYSCLIPGDAPVFGPAAARLKDRATWTQHRTADPTLPGV